MKVSYIYKEEDYKKYLLNSRKKSNVILFIIAVLIYFCFLKDKIQLIYLPLYIICVLVIIFMLNKLYIAATIKVNYMLNYIVCGKYTLELKPNNFSITINKIKNDYKYNEIKKVITKKNYFILKFNKTRDSLIFEKKFLKEEDYLKIMEMFREKVK